MFCSSTCVGEAKMSIAIRSRLSWKAFRPRCVARSRTMMGGLMWRILSPSLPTAAGAASSAGAAAAAAIGGRLGGAGCSSGAGVAAGGAAGGRGGTVVPAAETARADVFCEIRSTTSCLGTAGAGVRTTGAATGAAGAAFLPMPGSGRMTRGLAVSAGFAASISETAGAAGLTGAAPAGTRSSSFARENAPGAHIERLACDTCRADRGRAEIAEHGRPRRAVPVDVVRVEIAVQQAPPTRCAPAAAIARAIRSAVSGASASAGS